MKRMIEDRKLSAIAEAIRIKGNTTEKMEANTIAERILSLQGEEGKVMEIVNGTITEIECENVNIIGDYVFYGCTSLQTVSCPAAQSIGSGAFDGCTSLQTVSCPAAQSIGSYAFDDCKLKTVNLPSVESIETYAFNGCKLLKTVNLPSVESIEAYAFNGCTALEWIDFSGCTSVPTLSSTSAFANVPATCQFKVPLSLLEAWKSATNWSNFANRIVGV